MRTPCEGWGGSKSPVGGCDSSRMMSGAGFSKPAGRAPRVGCIFSSSLALSTGARQGELLGLRWADVDLGRGQAVLHHTKNQERRALPLTGVALGLLKDQARVRRIDTDFVFAGRAGRPVFPRKAWVEALRAAQIEDFRFHDLRHSAASELAMTGATLAEIAEVLGHKTLAMVKRYSHLTEQHTSKVVARMNERIFGADE